MAAAGRLKISAVVKEPPWMARMGIRYNTCIDTSCLNSVASTPSHDFQIRRRRTQRVPGRLR